MNITIDLSKSKLTDWRLVAKAQKGFDVADIPEWLEFIERVVVGGADALPMTALGDVIRQISATLADAANPKAPTA